MSDRLQRFYLATLGEAMARPASGATEAALGGFLSLNAAYFLGEWLDRRTHARLVHRLAESLDGLAGLPIPDAEVRATQLAQHARELTAAFGPTPWTERIAGLTEWLIPEYEEDWTASVLTAIQGVRAGADGGPLLLTHARRRLWELGHALTGEGDAAPTPKWALRYARRAVAGGDGRAIQVAEAMLAELVYGPDLRLVRRIDSLREAAPLSS